MKKIPKTEIYAKIKGDELSRIINDERKIKALYFNDPDESCYRTKEGYEIEAYGEPREFCRVAFFEVKKNGQIISRIPATHVEVQYERT